MPLPLLPGTIGERGSRAAGRRRVCAESNGNNACEKTVEACASASGKLLFDDLDPAA